MTVTIFKNIIETKEPFYLTIDKVVERIKTGKSKKLVNKIRGEYTKEGRNEFKKQLPSICFSGIFEARANDKIKTHSGIVCLDFDHLDNPIEFKEKLAKDKHIMCAFISPSGDGLKVLIKIPANKETHKESCKALKDYFKNDKLDNFEDVARVCFESYDPDIYYNPDSELFKELIYEETRQIQNTVINTDSNQIFDNLKKWIENIDYYHDGNKHKFLVKFAGALNRFGIPLYEASNLLIHHYQSAASFVKSEDIEKIVNKVYNSYRNQFNISFFEKNGTPIERTTKKKVTAEIFKEYNDNEDKEFKLKNELAECFNDPDSEHKEPPTILSIRDFGKQSHTRVLTLGNISTIKGGWKSKKSYFQSILAASLVSNCEIFESIIPDLPDNKRQVLLFDTEQSKYDSWKLSKRIRKMSKCNTEHFGSFSLRGKDAKKIIELIDYAIKLYPQTGIIFIDQTADLVLSLNDEIGVIEVVRFLEKISANNNLHICNVIHINKHDGFAQGWLGTQLMKKSEIILNVKKHDTADSISIVSVDAGRGVPFDDFSFQINGYGYPEMIDKLTHIELTDEDI